VMDSHVRIPNADVTSGSWADTTRLHGELGFVPQVSLEEGIERTVRALLGVAPE